MIILRQVNFSSNYLIGKLTDKLEKDDIEEYEVDDSIPSDSISIKCDLNHPEIYLPKDFEYSQYDIEDFIRSMVPYMRVNIELDRNIYRLSLNGRLNENQFYKLIKHIIEENEFCTLLENY